MWREGASSWTNNNRNKQGCSRDVPPAPTTHLLSSGSSFINAINISIACSLLTQTAFMEALSGTEIRLDLVCLRPSLLSPLSQSNYVTISLLQLQLQLPNPQQFQILTSCARLVVYQTCEMSFISRHPFWQLTCQVFSTKINGLRLATARQTR